MSIMDPPVEVPSLSGARIPATCWGGTEHTLHEVCLSNCKHGCKVTVCSYCRKRFVLHNPSYGCRIR